MRWTDVREIAIALAEAPPGRRAAVGPVHRPAPLGARAAGVRRRSRRARTRRCWRRSRWPGSTKSTSPAHDPGPAAGVLAPSACGVRKRYASGGRRCAGPPRLRSPAPRLPRQASSSRSAWRSCRPSNGFASQGDTRRVERLGRRRRGAPRDEQDVAGEAGVAPAQRVEELEPVRPFHRRRRRRPRRSGPPRCARARPPRRTRRRPRTRSRAGAAPSPPRAARRPRRAACAARARRERRRARRAGPCAPPRPGRRPGARRGTSSRAPPRS